MKLIFDTPINNLSFGNVAVNLIREMNKKSLDLSLFPKGGRVELETYDNLEEGEIEYIKKSVENRHNADYTKTPSLKLWHINGSEETIGRDNFLFSFYECDQPTKAEVNILKKQKWTFFSSSYAVEVFKNAGVENVSFCPLGFDPDFKVLDNQRKIKGRTTFSLMGKLESRKNTVKIIANWAKLYGNNPNYFLVCLIDNPFIQGEQINEYENKVTSIYGNIKFSPFLKNNSLLNRFMNSVDIDLTGLSSAEGWNLPSFNSAALGNIVTVTDYHAHKDWADPTNAVMVTSKNKVDCYDGAFFRKGMPFNQGQFLEVTDEAIQEAMKLSLDRFKKEGINKSGLKLQKEFTYEKTLETILDKI